MAQMNRNVNLEEIDADALFGIDALKNQTMLQKIVFFGCLAAGVFLNVLLPLYYETPRIVCVFFFLGLLMVGVAVGCNYTEDMTYGKYFYFFFFRPSISLSFQSTEDVEVIRKNAILLKKEEEMVIRRKEQADPKAQRKLLMQILIFVTMLVLFVGGIFLYGAKKEQDRIHHKVEVITEVEDERQ